MSIEHIRKIVSEGIRQGLAQSDLDLEEFPTERQESLVDNLSDIMLKTFDSLIAMEYEENNDLELKTADEEVVVWKGRPFLSLVESYIITSERIKVTTGFMSRHFENYELIRIQDIDFNQNISERLLNLGDITIRGQDPSDPTLVLRNIPNPELVYETLRKAWLIARDKYGLEFREFM